MPKTQSDLISTLKRLDGRGYKAYRDIQGRYSFPGFELDVDHVQGDPYAPPSRVRVLVPVATAGFPQDLWSTPVRRKALSDFLNRALFQAAKSRSREISVYGPGQKVLERSSIVIDQGKVEARFWVGLPARGRRIMGHRAAEILGRDLPELVMVCLTWARIDQTSAQAQVKSVEDQQALRAQLKDNHLAAFVAEGSTLPRAGGNVDTPLARSAGALPFVSPPSLAVTLDTPYSGQVRGMGVPEGVTLIVGGGFHGKSTLLKALEQGIYDHLPGDGRERVVSREDCLKIRSEDGRSVTGVDISPFINDLPGGRTTHTFSTANASGSTSQAAAIMEGLEAGAGVLLMDEDTSATNFMIRDKRMQRLVAKEKEPITPFLDRVRELHREFKVSTILVMGGCGDYFEAADTVIMMDNYLPLDVTGQARDLAGELPTGRLPEPAGPFRLPRPRKFQPRSFDASKGRREISLRALGVRGLIYGRNEVDLSGLEQLAEEGQTRAVGLLINRFGREMSRNHEPIKGLARLLEQMGEQGLDLISPWPAGDLARPRLLEVIQALNRMRSLKLL